MRSAVPRRPSAVVLLFALACAPGFQVKTFHTNSDLFNAAFAEFNRRHWDNAVAGFERLTIDLSARDTLLPRAHWYLAMAHEGRGEHLLAATSFTRLAESFPDDSLADDALLAAGHSYAKLWRLPGLDPTYGDLAQTQYRLLLSIFPDSPLRAAATEASRVIDEKMATKDYENGLFYVRRRAFDSALIYFKDVVTRYPNTSRVRDALLRMVEVYNRPEMNYRDEAKETCATLRSAYAGDRDVNRLCPAAVAADSSAARAKKPDRPAP